MQAKALWLVNGGRHACKRWYEVEAFMLLTLQFAQLRRARTTQITQHRSSRARKTGAHCGTWRSNT